MTDMSIPTPMAMVSPGKLKLMKKELTMLAILVGLAVLTAVLNPVFLGGDNLRNTVRHISLISLFALGEAVVIIAGGIDLSVGSIICISAVTTSYLTMYAGFGIGSAVSVAIALSLLIGFAQGLVITWLGVQPFVVTLGSMLLLRGVAEVMTGGTDIGFQGKYPGFRFLGEGLGLGMPMPFWFALVAIVITAFLMHRTLFGRYCYAIGSNSEAARLSGVPVQAIRLVTFIASAGLSGVAGVLYVAYLPSATPSLGSAYELHAVAAAVLGGCSLLGKERVTAPRAITCVDLSILSTRYPLTRLGR
jgi:ribose transport system permease protein